MQHTHPRAAPRPSSPSSLGCAVDNIHCVVSDHLLLSRFSFFKSLPERRSKVSASKGAAPKISCVLLRYSVLPYSVQGTTPSILPPFDPTSWTFKIIPNHRVLFSNSTCASSRLLSFCHRNQPWPCCAPVRGGSGGCCRSREYRICRPPISTQLLRQAEVLRLAKKEGVDLRKTVPKSPSLRH